MLKRRETRYKLSKIGEDRLRKAHPVLQALVMEMLFYKDLSVIETVRSLETQKAYVEKGVSKTLKSKHLPDEEGYSRAIDIYPYPLPLDSRGNIDSSSREWDMLALAAYYCAGKLGIKGLVWGGFWTSFIDKPHFELED